MNSYAPTQRSRGLGWTGWVFFGAAILFINGMFSVVQGLLLLIGPDTYSNTNGDLFILDVTGWGWWNVIIGVLLLVTGGALFSGATWARVVAVFIVTLSATSQLLLVPVQPFWSVIVISIDVLVVYALIVHGGDAADEA